MKNSLILYSGGMDSTVLLYEKREEIALAVSFNYGSKHNDRELYFASLNTKKLDIEHVKLDLSDIIGKHFSSNLLKTGGEIPDGHYQEPIMKQTVVPFRNGIMLSIAVGLAESRGLKKIYLANHFGDHAIYPDCTSAFIEPFKEAAKAGTYEKIEIVSPYVSITKRDIALIGKDINVPFKYTWSCYKGKEHHCGTCGTCVERKEALEGFDETVYA